eukprot:TRINITY_DN27197_c0_g1_i1.p1 TRINITY_DN27197_c0_g1~~TRINITY_DN27197_c0_g1_i1.p1  ORF type:complete len:308 (-),score=62.31 TRINITY_DN27197_c0_g1_i1:108-1031(-)
MALGQFLILLLLPVHESLKVVPGSPVLLQKGEESGPVKMTVLVEAFCPGCIQWVEKGLKPMMQDKEFNNAMDVELVWYGNAHQDENDMPVCQHGVNECVGNAILECSKKVLPQEAMWDYTFCMTGKIYTMMFTNGGVMGDQKKGKKESNLIELNKTISFLPGPAKGGISEQCAMKIPKVKAKWDEIKSCAAGDDGLNLLRRGAQITMSAYHMHTPWVSTYSRGAFDLDWKILGAGFQHQPLAENNPPGFICEKSSPSLRPSHCAKMFPDAEEKHAAKPCGKGSPCFFSTDSDVCLKDGLITEVSVKP